MPQTELVAIADDRRLFREGLARIFQAAGHSIVGVDECLARRGTVVLGVVVSPPRVGARVIRLRDAATVAELIELVASTPSRHGRESVVTPGIVTKLTDRETEVLTAVSAGGSTRDIGSSMGISPRTVERHIQAVFGKLGVRSRAEAVARSMTLGLLSTGS